MSVKRTQSERDFRGRVDNEARGENDSFVVSLLAAITEVQDETGESPVLLYDHIDVEALEQLLAHAESRDESEWELTFAVDDVDVTVTSDGDFTVE